MAEVLLHRPEVGKEAPGRRLHLQESLPELRVVEEVDPPLSHPPDLRLDGGLPAFELADPRLGIGLAPFGHLAEKLDDGQKTGGGPDKGPLLQGSEPFERLLGGGGDVEVGKIRIQRIILAKPPPLIRGPLLKIVGGLPGIASRPRHLPDGKKRVLQSRKELGPREGPDIRKDVALMEETRHKGRAVGQKEAPGGVEPPQCLKPGVVDGKGPWLGCPHDVHPVPFSPSVMEKHR
jgi:hypothetical protein